MIVTDGRNYMLDIFYGRASVGTIGSNAAYMAIGTSNTAVNLSDTKLGNEVGRAKLTTGSRLGNNGSVMRFVSDINSGSGSIYEVGIFATGYDSTGSLQTVGTGSATGILFMREIVSVYNKAVEDNLRYTIDYAGGGV